MKKLLLCLLLMASCATVVSAQDKNILSVRAGLSMSNMVFRTGSRTTSVHHRNSFHVGVVDQLRILRSAPLYLEAGLFLNDAGTKVEPIGKHLEALYLVFPVAVNYHFPLGKEFAFIPHAGLYYGVGIAGSFGVDPTFGKDGTIGSRSDFGARFGMGASWRGRYYLSIGFQGSIVGIKVTEHQGTKMRNRSVNFTLGYSF